MINSYLEMSNKVIHVSSNVLSFTCCWMVDISICLDLSMYMYNFPTSPACEQMKVHAEVIIGVTHHNTNPDGSGQIQV